MTEPITLEPDYETMAVELQARCEAFESLASDRQYEIDELEEEVKRLKAIIKYLEDKLGINDPI